MINTRLAVNGERGAASSSTAGKVSPFWSAVMQQEKSSPSIVAETKVGGAAPPVRRSQTKWMVSKSGVLYQSFDDGVRWQSVTVRENVELRCVSFLGDDIWAGGNSGALFHSRDAGRRWTQVVPSSNGLTLTDNIQRVEFTDADRKAVTTTLGDVWVTADNGVTWERR